MELKDWKKFSSIFFFPHFVYKQICSLSYCYVLIRVSLWLSPPLYRAFIDSCKGVGVITQTQSWSTLAVVKILSSINRQPPKTVKHGYILHQKNYRETKCWIYLTGRVLNDIAVIFSCIVNYWIKPSVSLATVPNEYYSSTMQRTVSVIESRSHL